MRSMLTRLTRLEARTNLEEAPIHEHLIEFVDTNHRVVETLLVRSEPCVPIRHLRGWRRDGVRQRP